MRRLEAVHLAHHHTPLSFPKTLNQGASVTESTTIRAPLNEHISGTDQGRAGCPDYGVYY